MRLLDFHQSLKSERVFFVLLYFVTVARYSFGQDAASIVKRADEKMRGETSQTEMVIKNSRPTWTQEMEMRTWVKGNSYAMILIQSQAKDRGTVFLKRKKKSGIGYQRQMVPSNFLLP